jgi:hypothetical protein
MNIRKLARRRSAVRELLQNLETRPFNEEAAPEAFAHMAVRRAQRFWSHPEGMIKCPRCLQ